MIKAIHETYSRDEPMIRASERSFGIVMAAAFGIISLFNWWHGGHAWYWSGGVATFFLSAALCYPSALTLLNRLWLKLGLLLHRW
jgi:hypothetical protein